MCDSCICSAYAEHILNMYRAYVRVENACSIQTIFVITILIITYNDICHIINIKSVQILSNSHYNNYDYNDIHCIMIHILYKNHIIIIRNVCITHCFYILSICFAYVRHMLCTCLICALHMLSICMNHT